MGSRTRRLVIVRLMAVVAISFMAIGHLLYSMTAGLDGYARLHMAVIAPSATSHKDLLEMMSQGAGEIAGHQRNMRQQRKNRKHAAAAGCAASHAHGTACTTRSMAAGGRRTKVRGSYSINPVADVPWDLHKLPFKDIAALNVHVKAHNASLVHVRHCPQLRLHLAVLRAGNTAMSKPSPWQPTARDERPGYVFSAYYDGRSHRPPPGGRPAAGRGSVKVIGISDVEGGQRPAFCQLWFANDDVNDVDDVGDVSPPGVSRSPQVVPVTAYPLSDPSTDRLAAFVYTCELPTRRPPVGVSLVAEACRPPTNYLPVARHLGASDDRSELAVCVGALPVHFVDADSLLQMTEVNRMFGADRFIFYNQSTGGAVDDHLRTYVGDNLAAVVPFGTPGAEGGMPGGKQHSPHARNAAWQHAARLVAANDCLYRNRFSAKYLVFLDVDEVLVPRDRRKWVDMLADVTPAEMVEAHTNGNSPAFASTAAMPAMINSDTGGPPAFYIKTAVFRTDRPDDARYAADRNVHQFHLTGLLKTERELIEPLVPHKLRYIVRPKQINMLSADGLASASGHAFAGLPVPESKALVHVYGRHHGRRQGAETVTQPSSARRPTVKDRILLPYYDVILARILERRERLENPIT